MITEERLKHCLGVARQCFSQGLSHNLSYDECVQLWIMGFLHDIGYEFVPKRQHEDYGGFFIKNMDCEKIGKIISLHGKPLGNPESLSDDEKLWWEILCRSDFLTSKNGEPISAQERLSDVIERYGEGSSEDKEMHALAKVLNLI